MVKYYFFAVLLFLFSCQKEIFIDIPTDNDKIAVSCFLSPDSTVQIYIEKVNSLYDTAITDLSNTLCILYETNTQIDTLQYYGNELFLSDYQPITEKEYQIKIYYSEQEVTAQTQIPQPAQITNITQKDFSVPDNQNDFNGDEVLPFCRLSITLNDNADEQNFYELSIILKRFWDDSTYVYVQNANIFSYDEIIKNENILDYEPQKIVFSDTLFNGQKTTINFLYHPSWLMQSSDGTSNIFTYGKYRLIYSLKTISKEMYFYRKSLIKHIYNQQTDNIEILGDPVQMYSNVNNGYGIFASFNEIRDTIFIDETDFYQ